jgi:hypothetical protein
MKAAIAIANKIVNPNIGPVITAQAIRPITTPRSFVSKRLFMKLKTNGYTNKTIPITTPRKTLTPARNPVNLYLL